MESNPQPKFKLPASKMTWHTFQECRYLYREYRCGHNEVVAIIGHRWCRFCKGGKGHCEPQGIQDYQFATDYDCTICRDERFAGLDEVKRQRLLWAQDARQAERAERGSETFS